MTEMIILDGLTKKFGSLIAVVCMGSAMAAEVHFRCDHESDTVRAQFVPGDQVPLGGYAVDIGWMETYTEDAWIITDPTCDNQSTMVLMLDGTTRVGEVHGYHTGAEPPGMIYEFSVKIGAERTDIFGARFGSQSPITGYQWYFVEFGGDGTIWVMGKSTGIPYRNVFKSNCVPEW